MSYSKMLNNIVKQGWQENNKGMACLQCVLVSMPNMEIQVFWLLNNVFEFWISDTYVVLVKLILRLGFSKCVYWNGDV